MEKKFVLIIGGVVLVALVVVSGLYFRRSPYESVNSEETSGKEEMTVVDSETKLTVEDVSANEDRGAKVDEIVQNIYQEIEDDGAAFENEKKREIQSLEAGGEVMTKLGTSYDESKY